MEMLLCALGVDVLFETTIKTRKSSCVNARCIPPAAQLVFAVLICPGLGGGGGTTLAGITYPSQGIPTLAVGVPTLAGGYLPWPGVPTLAGGRGVPTLAGVPLGVDRQMPVKTVPSPILRMKDGLKLDLERNIA